MTIQLKVFMSVFLIILLTAILTMPLEVAAQEAETAEVTANAATDAVTTDVTDVITEPIVFDVTSVKTDTVTEPQSNSETTVEDDSNSDISTETANGDITNSDEIALPPGAFTPDGNATVIDNVTDGTKEFFTIKTADDAVFYLVVDRQRNSENVYFLNAVTVDDLIPLAKNSDSIKSTDTSKSVATENGESATDDEKTSEKPAPEKKESNLPLIIIAVIAVGGVAYYVKIIRPKKAGGDMSDMEFDEEVDEDSELNFEDENEDDEVYIEEKDE